MVNLFRGFILLVTALLVACGDDDSDFATRPSDESSSSVCEDCDDESSFSSSSKKSSGSVVGCKTETEDNCEYGELVDDRDGQTYKTVKIGDQWWMAENLNYETDVNYCYNDDTTNCTKYGRFYAWWTALTACPNGWHLPDTTEWKKLFTVVGDSSTVGLKLKSTSGWNSSGNGTDFFGFSALPAGGRLSDGGYYGKGNHADFWSSTESDDDDAYDVYLYYGIDDAYLSFGSKDHWVSVRCVKDDP